MEMILFKIIVHKHLLNDHCDSYSKIILRFLSLYTMLKVYDIVYSHKLVTQRSLKDFSLTVYRKIIGDDSCG